MSEGKEKRSRLGGLVFRVGKMADRVADSVSQAYDAASAKMGGPVGSRVRTGLFLGAMAMATTMGGQAAHADQGFAGWSNGNGAVTRTASQGYIQQGYQARVPTNASTLHPLNGLNPIVLPSATTVAEARGGTHATQINYGTSGSASPGGSWNSPAAGGHIGDGQPHGQPHEGKGMRSFDVPGAGGAHQAQTTQTGSFGAGGAHQAPQTRRSGL